MFEIYGETPSHCSLHVTELVPQTLRPALQPLRVHQELLQVLQVGLQPGRLLVLLVQFPNLHITKLVSVIVLLVPTCLPR